MNKEHILTAGAAVILFCSGCHMDDDFKQDIDKLGLRLDKANPKMLMRPRKVVPVNLEIPYGVEVINKEAFRQAFRPLFRLESVVIPDSVTSIGDYVFTDCNKLEKVKFSAAMKHTGNYTFMNCPVLSEVILPPRLEKIGYSAFENCTSLKHITIPDTVTVIDDYAFANCTALESIVIPASVKYIAYRAFKGCKNLKDVKILNPDIALGLEVFDK